MTEKLDEEGVAHHKHGPSGLKDRSNCRGFRSHDQETEATARGTRIHLALENDDPSEITDEDEFVIYEQCRTDREHARGQMYALTGISNPLRHAELRLEIDLGATKTFGTADIVDVYGDMALLFDYKSGVSYIDSPPENKQAMAYAIGVFQKFPAVNKIFAQFSVPVRHETPEGWYSRENLSEYIREIGTIIIETEFVWNLWESLNTVPVELLSPGDWCRYCQRQLNNSCPAMGAVIFDVVKRYDGGGLLPADGSIHGSDIDDPETLAKLYPVAIMAEKWAGGIKHKAKTVAIENGGLPGYDLKSAGAPRVVSDTKAAIEFSESAGLSVEELLPLASFSLGNLIDLVKSKAPRGQKQDAARNYEAGLEAFGALTRQAERFKLQSIKGGADED